MDAAMPMATPAARGLRLWMRTSPSSSSAATGRSSPPVARGRAAVGKTVMACRVRTRGPVGPRQRARAMMTTMMVNSEKATRASVSRGGALVSRARPKTDIRGRYGL